jgi:hypothetical protein
VEGGFLLDVVVGEGSSVFELLSGLRGGTNTRQLADLNTSLFTGTRASAALQAIRSPLRYEWREAVSGNAGVRESGEGRRRRE